MWILPLYLHVNQKSGDDDGEVLQRGASNEYPQRMFMWRSKNKNVKTFWLKKVSFLKL